MSHKQKSPLGAATPKRGEKKSSWSISRRIPHPEAVNNPPRLDRDELVELLKAEMPRLAKALLPGGFQRGADFRAGDLAGSKGESLWVSVDGNKCGAWFDHATGEGGGPLDLIMATQGLDFISALNWSASWLGHSQHYHLDNEHRARLLCEAEARRKASRVEADAMAAKARAAAADLWHESQSIFGTAAQTYLSNRGIGIAALKEAAAELRFHSQTWDSQTRLRKPCLVARVTATEDARRLVGMHRTFLLPDGSDRDRGAGKRRLGGGVHGVVRLTPDQEVSSGLGIGEGLETCLSILSQGWRPVWCAIDAGGVKSFPILPGIEALTVYADSDVAGRAAATAVVERWRQAGREARAFAPRADGVDFNDLVREAA